MESDSRSGNPRLLVLGAGPAQLGLLEAARARGLWVAVADRDPAAPGFPLADRRCILSTEDEPAIERLVGALGIDGIIAPGTDWPVGVAARIAAHAGLAHPISPQTAVLATNKLKQREALGAAGVPQPRSWVVGGDDDVPKIQGPVVVKAPDRQGQKGLTLVESPDGLAAAIELARAAARSGLALVEELVDGPEVTVVGFSVDGTFTALTVTDRLTADPPAFGVALAHVWPSHVQGPALDTAERDAAGGLTPNLAERDATRGLTPLDPKLTDPVADANPIPDAPEGAKAAGLTPLVDERAPLVAERAVAALGIRNGPSYTQLRIGPDGPRVIEVAARLGGGHDAELVEAAVGVDLNGLALDAALGLPLVAPTPAPQVGGAVTRFLVAPPGVLERVEVPAGVRARIYREPGFVFHELRRGSDRAGAVLATGASREDAVARADAAAERIRFFTADAGALLQAN